MLWASVTTIVLLGGIWVARKRSPEIKHIQQGENEMQMILHLAQSAAPEVHIYFRRSEESGEAAIKTTRLTSPFIPPGWAASPPG